MVLKGEKILGNVKFASAPISAILKNLLSLLDASLEAPILPRPDISRVSDPLNRLRINKEVNPAIPIS